MNFIQQAYKGLNDFWRYFLAILIVMSPFILSSFIYIFYPEMLDELMNESSKINSSEELAEQLITFGVFLLILFGFVKFLHKRDIKTIITSRKKVDWKRFFFSFMLWFSISALMIFVGYLIEPEMFVWNFKPSLFLLLLVISFLLFPIQTTFEELVFRGYLMQGFGLLAKNRWFPLILTSVFFGLAHMANPEVEKLGPLIMVYFIGTGLFLGILTLLDEGTELAMGFHAANNIAAAIFVTQTWTVFQTDALFIDHSEPSLGFETFIPVFVLYPIVLFIFAKKYHWINFKEKLIGKIEEPKKDNFFEEETFLEV